MAFSYTIDTRPKSAGSGRTITGTFTNAGGGDTGGNILLAGHLRTIHSATANGDAAGATDVEIDATVGTTLTLVTAGGLDGVWSATGTR